MTLKTFLLMVAAEILSGFNIQYRLLYYPSSFAPSEESLKADNKRSCIEKFQMMKELK
jgi:hypothetical protein